MNKPVGRPVPPDNVIKVFILAIIVFGFYLCFLMPIIAEYNGQSWLIGDSDYEPSENQYNEDGYDEFDEFDKELAGEEVEEAPEEDITLDEDDPLTSKTYSYVTQLDEGAEA